MSGTWRLRGYVLESLLGAGATGEVWRARVAASGEPVALKRLPTPSAQEAARAQSEAALLGALDHPNLIRLHSAVPCDGATVLVLDLADGGSLAQLLAARGRLTPGETVTALAPIAAALGYLHDEGVTHGDVSAGNILFTTGGVAMLGDVGAARLAADDREASATPGYVDPVVAAGGLPGPPSDVFMLAAVAVHALTGEPLWRAGDPDAALALAARADLRDLSERLAAADVPPPMQAVLRRALSVDPARRGSAVDCALDLRHAAQAVAVELAAGQERPTPRLPAGAGPRHAARPAARPADAARPEFERPALLPGGALAPPTRQVEPRPRPLLPRPTRRSARARRWLLSTLVAAAVLGAGGLAWTQRGPAPRRPAPVAVQTAPSGPPTPTGPTALATLTPRPAAVELPADWAAALRALDALRARAFATRDPALLAQVYQPGVLLTADRRRLAATVPAGCTLSGARTHYAGLRVRASARGAVVEAVATLPPTRLACGGASKGVVPGLGPVRLRIALSASAAGPRIADERVAQS